MTHALRITLMIALLAAGSLWLRPTDPAREAVSRLQSLRFVERAEAAGCRFVHTPCRVSDQFANIMPWLTSVGAAVAAADFDADGDADLYVTDSGRDRPNRLFRNRGDGTFELVPKAAQIGCGNQQGACMGAVWGDFDNDGDLDLYVVKWGDRNALFRNDGDGNFTEIGRTAGVDFRGYSNGAILLDYDRDGRLDILLTNYFPDTVPDPATGKPVRNDLWNPVTTRIMHETFTHARNGGRNILYRSRGDGTFEDVSARVGLTVGGWALAAGAGDLNNDGWPDLYIANDFGPDELYFNTGATEQPPRYRLFIDPRGHPGVGNDWWKGMNVDLGDVNNDGYLDLYVTNILSRRYKTDEGNMLWLNGADPLGPGGRGFRNIAKASNTYDGGWGWAGRFADFNHDGLLDIYTVNGFISGRADKNYWFAVQEMVTQTKNQTVDARDWPEIGDRDLSGHERGRLFIQLPPAGHDSRDSETGPRFVECAEACGITDTYNGRGLALADFDLNGTMDFYVANQGQPSCLYLNQLKVGGAGQPGFLRILLVGRPDRLVTIGGRALASTRDAVGARVTVHTKAGQQIREVQAGAGFAAQSEYALHFGLPDPSAVEKITIQWPSGRTQIVDGEASRRLVNHHVRVTEGDPPVIVK